MPTVSPAAVSIRKRLAQLAESGQALESEGLPFPTQQIRDATQDALEVNDLEQANKLVKRGEALLGRASQDWVWVRELLRRADELRAIAGTLGVDLQHLDARVGNPRTRLQTDPLSSGSLEKAAASASLALAVLNDAVPKFCVQEAQLLGQSIRRARDRGEDVHDSAASFSRLIQAIQDQNLPTSAQRLVETRKTVARIPRAPALPALSPREEEEILLEARNLARRLQRIKGKARDAHSAARLMAQVRAALSEDRRYGTPEEEIEQLWLEVDRLTKERQLASEPVPPQELPAADPPEPNGETFASLTDELDDLGAGDVSKPEPEIPDEEERRPLRRSLLVPYVPPEGSVPSGPSDSEDGSPADARTRARPRPRP